MARIGNAEPFDRKGQARRDDNHKSLPEKRFGLRQQDLAMNDTASKGSVLSARPEGLEPPTLGSEDRCSIQLSYGRNSLIGKMLRLQPFSGTQAITPHDALRRTRHTRG